MGIPDSTPAQRGRESHVYSGGVVQIYACVTLTKKTDFSVEERGNGGDGLHTEKI